eukprot:Nitzschia sp. Nitz4//scaffold229_size32011//11092//11367//NITZ4_007916-RA/size32011-processed-gene-0.8-mRNA-1//1//CDS//3329542850//7542//frame0
MTLSAMRRALESADENEVDLTRTAPEERGVKESRSLLVEIDQGSGRKGTLTFANSVRELRRAGSSRENSSGGSPGVGLRKPPARSQSCMQG